LLAKRQRVLNPDFEGSGTLPDLKTTLHTEMLSNWRRRRSVLRRVVRAVRRELRQDVYGLDWGDPETVEPLKFIKDRWVIPYVKSDQRAVEIGPGGGRWTRYLLGFQQLYAVDCHLELLKELRRNYRHSNIVFVHNAGTDFPNIPEGEIDYVLSFGTFVHLDAPIIEAYLRNLRAILKHGGNAVIHYADQMKVMARENPGFSKNHPDMMRRMVREAGFKVLEEDLTTMWHSSLIRFTH
jgi:SAM-dependent methyltransferase